MRSSDSAAPLLFGFLTGLRSMSAAAALAWAAQLQRTRPGWEWAARLRWDATILAAAEIAGDKLPGAPDRRIAPSFLLRLLVGGAGAAALGGSPARGIAMAFVGTLLGRGVRGAHTRTKANWQRALSEDLAALAITAATVQLAKRPVPGNRRPSPGFSRNAIYRNR